MPVQSTASYFWALNGHQLGINCSISVKIWYFRGVRSKYRNLLSSGITKHPQRDSNPCRHLERVVS